MKMLSGHARFMPMGSARATWRGHKTEKEPTGHVQEGLDLSTADNAAMSLTEIKPGLLTNTEPAWRGWLSNNEQTSGAGAGTPIAYEGVGSCSCA